MFCIHVHVHVQKSQQPHHDDRKAPSSPQQPPISSVHVTITPSTLTQPTSPTVRQQTKIGKFLLSLILWDIYMSTWIYYTKLICRCTHGHTYIHTHTEIT